MQAKLEWHTEKRRLKDLTPLEKNPFGKISDEGKKRLEKSLLKLGVFKSATIDLDGTLLGFNKRYHALLLIHGKDYEIEVKTPSRNLTEAERQEIIVVDNTHEGEWDHDILRTFEDLDFDELGLKELLEDDTLSFDEVQKSNKIELKPYDRVHVLISFHPDKIGLVEKYLKPLIENEDIEYEQASN